MCGTCACVGMLGHYMCMCLGMPIGPTQRPRMRGVGLVCRWGCERTARRAPFYLGMHLTVCSDICVGRDDKRTCFDVRKGSGVSWDGKPELLHFGCTSGAMSETLGTEYKVRAGPGRAWD